jgi:branched-chain amino acid aminotransferase
MMFATVRKHFEANRSEEGSMVSTDLGKYTGYMNGKWVPGTELKIHIGDRGVKGGDTVFDVARTFDGKSFRMKQHVDRLYRSLKYARIDPGMPSEEMFEISEEAIRRNEHLLAEAGDLLITQLITRGFGRWAHSTGPATVIVEVLPCWWEYAPLFETGTHGVIARTRSYSAESLDPKIKHFSRMNMNLAELEAADVDPEAWPILADIEGNLTEGTGQNIFLVTNGVVRTPGDTSVLQGVSRAAVIDLAHRLNIPVVEEDLQPYDLYTADEAFFASTSPCVLPVTRVDRRQVGDGKPGSVTQQLLAAWSEEVGLDIVDQALAFDRG